MTNLDEPELVDFLQRNHRAFLFCRDEGRRPIGYAMRSVAYEPGHLYFVAYAKSAKIRHMRADPRAACVVMSEGRGEGWPSWISLEGSVVVYRPSPAEIETVLERSSPEPRVSDAVVTKVHDRLLSGKRSFIRLGVDQVRARG